MPFDSAGRAKIGSSAKLGRTKWAYAKYKFADHGGTQGVITLTGDTIPAGAHLLHAVLMVDTVPTSGGAATIALKVDDATLDAAVAISGAPYSTTGNKLVDHTFAAAPLKPTAASKVTATVGTADLTAGVFRVIVAYVEVDAA